MADFRVIFVNLGHAEPWLADGNAEQRAGSRFDHDAERSAAWRLEPAVARVGRKAVEQRSVAVDETHQRFSAEVEAQFDTWPFG